MDKNEVQFVSNFLLISEEKYFLRRWYLFYAAVIQINISNAY